MKYFENESDVITLQELSIENRLDRVSIFGSLDITRDKQGLELALKLQCIVEGIVNALEQVKDELQIIFHRLRRLKKSKTPSNFN